MADEGLRAYFALRRQIVGFCAAVGCRGDVETACRDGDALVGRVSQMEDRVRGNRPGNYAMTPDDFRLLMAATLRECLEYLEAPAKAG